MEIDDIYELRQMMGSYFIDKASYNLVKSKLPLLLKDRNTFEALRLTTNDGGKVDVILGRDLVLLHSTKEVRERYRTFMEKLNEEGKPKVGFSRPVSRGIQ